MSSVSKRDHAPPTGQTPGKKASKRRAVSRNSKKSLFQDEEPKPDVKVCPKIVGWYIVLVYNLIAYTTQPLSRYIKNNIWHLHTLSVDESQSLCRKFECRKDYYYKTMIYRPSILTTCVNAKYYS